MPKTTPSHAPLNKRARWSWPRLFVYAGSAAVLVVVAFLLYRWWIVGSVHFEYPTPDWSPDQSLPTTQEHRPGVDLATTTPDDFPEFLGPGRQAAVDHIRLDPDWKQHPPELVWRNPIGGGWSSFSAVNGFAVTMEQRGKKEQVSCYAIASGKHHWSVSWDERFTIMGVGPRSTPTISGGRVYALGAWGHLVCIDGSRSATVHPCWQR